MVAPRILPESYLIKHLILFFRKAKDMLILTSFHNNLYLSRHSFIFSTCHIYLQNLVKGKRQSAKTRFLGQPEIMEHLGRSDEDQSGFCRCDVVWVILWWYLAGSQMVPQWPPPPHWGRSQGGGRCQRMGWVGGCGPGGWLERKGRYFRCSRLLILGALCCFRIRIDHF